MVKQERAQSRLEVDRQDALEREDKKQLDQLVRQQKSVIAATAVEPKVKQSFSHRHPSIRSFVLRSSTVVVVPIGIELFNVQISSKRLLRASIE